MQYKTGTVAVTNANNGIVGTGTTWLGNVSIGSVFSVSASGVPYIVANVVDNTHITLASNYGGATLAGLAYAITTSYTQNQKLPYPEQGDIDTATILKRAMVTIDALLGVNVGAAAQASRVVYTDANGNLTTSANLSSDGTRLTVNGTNSSTIDNNAAAATLLVGGNVNGGLIYMKNAAGSSIGGISNRKAWVGSGADGMAIAALTGFGIDLFVNNSGTPSMQINSAGSFGIKGNPDVRAGIIIGGVAATSGTIVDIGTEFEQTVNGQANNSAYGVGFSGGSNAITINKAGSGTHPDFACVYIGAPVIGAGAGALTNATTLKINDAPSVGTSKRALWVAAGLSQFGGTVTMDGSLGVGASITATSGNVSSAAFVAVQAGAQTYLSDGTASYFRFRTTGAANIGYIMGSANGLVIDTDGTSMFTQFNIGGTEKARMTNAGFTKHSDSGTYDSVSSTVHEFNRSTNTANPTLIVKSTSATAANQQGVRVILAGDPNDAAEGFFSGFGNATLRFQGDRNGGLRNFSANNVNLSDGTIKVGMTPAPDYCDFVEKASTLLKIGAYEDDPTRRMHTMFDSRDVELLDPSLISPWQHSPLMVLKGLSEHEIQMRHFGATGAMLRRLKVIEKRLGI